MTHQSADGLIRHQPYLPRRAVLLGTAAVAAAWLTGCDRAASRAAAPQVLRAAEVERTEPPATAPVAECGTGMLDFAHQLLTATAGPTQNWLVSPLSIAGTFAMARAGALGSTAAQLDQVFGFPATGRDDAYNAITRELVTTDQPSKDSAQWKEGDPPPDPVVCLGNALFTAKDLTVGAQFLRTLAAAYGAGVRPVDFASAEAGEQINTWVKEQTAGRITKLFDQLGADTRLVLANAVYFKGYWKLPFPLGQKPASPFTKIDGSQVAAPTMSQAGSFRYAAKDGVSAVELPYSGGPYSMLVILPPKGTSPAKALEPATVTAVLGALAARRIAVSLPRFGFATDLDLGSALPQLGLTAPFSAEADFSGISPGLTIGQAVHRANIDVDDVGTEAAAVTGLSMKAAAPAPPELSFVANRPFAFLILGGEDQIPLFAGQVHDPTAS